MLESRPFAFVTVASLKYAVGSSVKLHFTTGVCFKTDWYESASDVSEVKARESSAVNRIFSNWAKLVMLK